MRRGRRLAGHSRVRRGGHTVQQIGFRRRFQQRGATLDHSEWCAEWRLPGGPTWVQLHGSLTSRCPDRRPSERAEDKHMGCGRAQGPGSSGTIEGEATCKDSMSQRDGMHRPDGPLIPRVQPEAGLAAGLPALDERARQPRTLPAPRGAAADGPRTESTKPHGSSRARLLPRRARCSVRMFPGARPPQRPRRRAAHFEDPWPL
mmetsp:Transcript_43669/g.123624  ORF Transcript_43669/g.123624 Transcript_43669/m.123624 type:complete len:203 (-) Transcript_43669:1152-1760(-)